MFVTLVYGDFVIFSLFFCSPDHCCWAEGRGNHAICWTQCKQTSFITQFYSSPFDPNTCCTAITTAQHGAMKMRCKMDNRNLFSAPCLFSIFFNFALREQDLYYELDPHQQVELAVCPFPPVICSMKPLTCLLPPSTFACRLLPFEIII